MVINAVLKFQLRFCFVLLMAVIGMNQVQADEDELFFLGCPSIDCLKIEILKNLYEWIQQKLKNMEI